MGRWGHLAALVGGGAALLAGAFFIMSKQTAGPGSVVATATPVITPVSFTDLTGWEDDAPMAALPPLALSCERLVQRADNQPVNARETLDIGDGPVQLAGVIADWRPFCEAVLQMAELPGTDNDTVRTLFEDMTVPVRISMTGTLQAPLITGYFEPIYPAARVPTDGMVPVLTQPDDIITADLGAFSDELAGRQVLGRVIGNSFVPYADQEEIITTPPRSSQPLGYLDPNDLLFMQIQGSGRLRYADGTEERVGYAGKNGRAYVAIGRSLVREGHLALEDVTMQSIEEWLINAAPEDAARIRYSNPSYVFFRPLDNLPDPALGPIGAQGLQLTPGRSIAIDPRYYPYGAPVFLELPEDSAAPFEHRLMVAQDTGGAIRGTQRADIFFGPGDDAAALAGRMNAPGTLTLLLPRPAFDRYQNAPTTEE
ncbi:murein transglycosylase A [Parvularcula sp. LCG005]|uniref:murein transglycosylase A n=1 Tax=Parvularcula sp. LCG005 TaxID=3078805 RepID=UPI002942CBB3|nr:MltA domain-containing protein [Parvularcula sp. LCG005]WOI53274.1 MltA domain-containing protein [Parvularcula sp. LCG005]